jgi:hypothetical protein
LLIALIALGFGPWPDALEQMANTMVLKCKVRLQQDDVSSLCRRARGADRWALVADDRSIGSETTSTRLYARLPLQFELSGFVGMLSQALSRPHT